MPLFKTLALIFQATLAAPDAKDFANVDKNVCALMFAKMEICAPLTNATPMPLVPVALAFQRTVMTPTSALLIPATQPLVVSTNEQLCAMTTAPVPLTNVLMPLDALLPLLTAMITIPALPTLAIPTLDA
jgi:hypothetical protein